MQLNKQTFNEIMNHKETYKELYTILMILTDGNPMFSDELRLLQAILSEDYQILKQEMLNWNFNRDTLNDTMMKMFVDIFDIEVNKVASDLADDMMLDATTDIVEEVQNEN